ncbi:MAG: single-stranded-DNA-specific exonuclease RecJ [Hyphomonadaceae bacterium]|nr:MAG: single-stranded-DNA-specific exonuclease [Caulobacteraceae bacterium]MBT9445048.1 single-stranded-DNA-specific exonuclease RecJ [Hyphomonadaceae bacterium]
MSAAAKPAPQDGPRAFLGVQRSLTGKLWRTKDVDDKVVSDHRRLQGLPEIAARLLAARGVGVAEARAFLEPTLRQFFPDPSSFKDMDIAARVIEDAIVSGRPTAVFADYDVDGGTSAAQLVRYFRARGRVLTIYVPDRMTEGYGPTAGAFARLKAMGVELVITVDCGAAAHEPLEAAAAMGLDLVVLDHHLMSGPPPPALAVVNPNRHDCTAGQGDLTAAGVVMVTLTAVNREARRRGSVGSNNLPDLLSNLDLAALGTVCDVAPLTKFNRAMVAQGLRVLARGENIGLKALAASAGKAQVGSVYDLGFILGPRLNAGGRVGDASLATRLLSTDDPAEAADLAAQLEHLNADRRVREAEMLVAAQAMAETEAASRAVAVVGDPSWHPGVIGIAAGRLKDRIMKPTIVLGGGGESEPAKGSGRSVPGVNLGRAVAAAAEAGVLRAGGGHAMAAGCTVDWNRVQDLRDFLSENLAAELAGADGEARALWIDATASIGAATPELMTALERIGPFGPGHPEPVFALPEVRVQYASAVKGEHVRFVLEDARGARIRGISFRSATTALGEALLAREGAFHAAVKLKRDTYGGGDRVEAELLDAAPLG